MSVETRPDLGTGIASTPGLRAFVEAYEQTYPEEVLRISQPVEARFEVTAIITRLEQQRKYPILIFENVTIDGRPAEFPLLTFMYSSRERIARAFGAPHEQVGQLIYERMQSERAPVVVDPAQAPVKEVRRTGDAVDLGGIPAPVHHLMDPGRYVTAGYLTCYNPETGIENSALHRGWISGPREIRLFISGATDNNLILARHEARGEDMRVAYWVGHHPVAAIGCELHIPIFRSHYAVAGAVMGSPMRLVPSESLGDDFLVPADADFVIEGIIPAGQRKPEGPFGEYPRYSGPQRWGPYMEVTAITHRRNAYWQDLMVGHTHWVASYAAEGRIYDTVKRTVPTLRAVYVPQSGCGMFHAYLQIDKRVQGQGRFALLAAFSADYRIKHAWVFDADVDIYDEREVMLALATRFQGEKDLIVVPDVVGPVLDPSAGGISGCKVGFDCTKPAAPAPFARRLEIPNDILDRTDLKEVLGPERLARIPVEYFG